MTDAADRQQSVHSAVQEDSVEPSHALKSPVVENGTSIAEDARADGPSSSEASQQQSTCSDCRELRKEVQQVKKHLFQLVQQFALLAGGLPLNSQQTNNFDAPLDTIGAGATNNSIAAVSPTYSRTSSEPSADSPTLLAVGSSAPPPASQRFGAAEHGAQTDTKPPPSLLWPPTTLCCTPLAMAAAAAAHHRRLFQPALLCCPPASPVVQPPTPTLRLPTVEAAAVAAAVGGSLSRKRRLSNSPPPSHNQLQLRYGSPSLGVGAHFARKKATPDDFVKEFVQALESVDNVNFEIPVPEALQCDSEFRPVTEEQILNSVKWTELEWKEAVIRLSKKLAEKRVFGPMLMARATVAGTNHSNYPNLPIQGIIYIESVCRRVLFPNLGRREFGEYFRPAIKGLAARCRRIRHSLKPPSAECGASGWLVHQQRRQQQQIEQVLAPSIVRPLLATASMNSRRRRPSPPPSAAIAGGESCSSSSAAALPSCSSAPLG